MKIPSSQNCILSCVLSFFVLTVGLFAQTSPPSPQAVSSTSATGTQANADDLAKAVSNPVSSLISLPIQENIDFGYANDGWRSTTNIQPVYPSTINDDWNLISRVILPVILQDNIGHNATDFGLGDTTGEFFFSPRQPGPGGVIWGVGPAVLLPTATKDNLGTGKWGAGPTAVVLWQVEKLTYGFLVNHLWSFAGDSDRAYVSSTFVQPFLSYAVGMGRTYSINSESSYDWRAGQWTIPINVMATQIIKLGGKQPASVGIGVRVYLDRAQGGPDWGLRFVFQMLFPK